MRAIFLSFLIFVVSVLCMLASFNLGVSVPPSYLRVAPLLVMGLAFLCQIGALSDYKQRRKSIRDLENQLEREQALKVQDLSARDIRIASLQGEVQAFQAQKDELARELTRMAQSQQELSANLQESRTILAQTERTLQSNAEELRRNSTQNSQTDLLTFLSLLQEKGRLLDFLMEDITAFSDAQIGAAGRVVHQGCSKVLREFFNISPLRLDDEGSVVRLDVNDSLHDYRILGKNNETTPFTAKILHRGWGTDAINIPRRSSTGDFQGKHVISPIEVEVS